MTLALVLMPLAGAIGVGIDYGRIADVRAQLQKAVDAAALAGAVDGTAGWATPARAAFDANIAGSTAESTSVSFTHGADGGYTATASATVSTTISRVVMNSDTFSLDATATAMNKSGGSTGSGGSVCILLLAPSTTQSLLVNSGAKITAPTCEIHVKSTASPAAIFNAGATVSTEKICIQGTTIIDNGGTHPNLAKGCATVSDPFAGKLPAPTSTSCTASNGNYNGGNVSLSPGVYCGWFNFNNNPTVHFAPGLYVIKGGGWNVNGGSWTGSGVTFYFADTSKIQFNSGIAATLSAPTSGTYKGILIYEPVGLARSQFVLDDSRGATLEGLIYLPSRDTTFNSGSQVSSDKLTMVLNTLIVNQTTWNLSPATTNIPVSGAPGGTAAPSGGVALVR